MSSSPFNCVHLNYMTYMTYFRGWGSSIFEFKSSQVNSGFAFYYS